MIYPSGVFAPLSPYSMAIPEPDVAHLLPAQSLAELYQVRDHIQTKIKQFPSGLEILLLGDTTQNENWLKTLQVINARIHLEETAQANWGRAQRLRSQAEKMQHLPQHSAATWKQAQTLWQQALNSLHAIPSDSRLAELKTRKTKEYEAYLATATHEAKLAQSAFLTEIAKHSGLSAQAMITVCHSSGVCRDLRGNQLPASPASLAKVPLAIALLQKTNAENISLDTSIYVEPGNFTEDASPKIRVGQHHSLRAILWQMIDHSSNIAANQLIDYLGSDYINQVLQSHGYQMTRVNHKFMGETTMPANPGQSKNRLTGNELTRMMMQIYNREHPSDEVLIKALNHQVDRNLGFAALQGSAAQWLGEKTGRNSQVLGTTVALKIARERYFITVIDSRSGDLSLRQCIAQIADHLVRQSH